MKENNNNNTRTNDRTLIPLIADISSKAVSVRREPQTP